MSSSGKPLIASDDWMREQQLRAELEAEAWRRLRLELATPEPAPAPVAPTPPPRPQPQPQPYRPPRTTEDPHYSGSLILKALVRFILGAFAAYLAYLAAVDSQLGEFDGWIATASTFAVTLALSMFAPLRGLVHFLAETMRWVIFAAIGVGGLWLAFHTWT